MECGPWQGGHHAGSIWQHKGAFYLRIPQIQHTERIYDKNLDVGRAKAVERQAELSLRMGLTKNRFRLVSNSDTQEQWYEMNLTREKTMLLDVADLSIAVSHTWATHAPGRSFYACTTIAGKQKYFHSIITGFPMVDHVNRDGLDNRRGNLRNTTYFDNSRNQGINSKNTTGRAGVGTRPGVCYFAHWSDHEGKLRCKSFSWNKYGKEKALELAIAHRRAMEKEYYKYDLAPDEPSGKVHQAPIQEKLGNKPFSCPMCEFTTAYKSHIPQHISRKHATQ
jgi:hypothetical protein